jgi:hypothetical protein
VHKNIHKTYLVALFALVVSGLFAKQYTCVKTGNWNTNSTWGTTSSPAATDTVTITGGFTVTVSATATINKVTINSGSTLKLKRNLTVSKILVNNGTFSGNRTLLFTGTGIVVTGTGSYTGHTSTIEFSGSTQTIDAGVVISKTTGNVTLNNTTFPGMVVTNNGQVLLTGGNTLSTTSNTKACTFTMGTNSVLSVSTLPLNLALGTLNASATGCVVNYYGGTYNIKIPSSNTYYDMTVQAGTKTNTAALIMHSLTVASGATFTDAGNNLTLSGNWTNNGTINSNTGTATFDGTSAQTITDASGTAAFGTLTMSGTSTLNFASGVSTTSNFTISSGTVDVTAANNSLSVAGNFTNNSTFTERSGLVTMNGTAVQSLGGTTATTFYDLTVNNTGPAIVTLGNNQTIKNFLIIISGTLDVSASNYSLTIGQKLTNNGTFTARTGTVTFTGNISTPLTINGSSATTFYNLTTDPTNATDIVDLGVAATISNNFAINNGEFNSQNFQITGNATGKMTMAGGTTLLLGLTTSATNILFPTNYTAANTTLNVSSTVTYQANTAQTISSTPTYGNVIVTNGNAAATKTPSGTPLNIDGNLTLTKGSGALTLSETTNTINLLGNFTSNGILSFNTGAFNIGGNYTNNGTFTAGTGTVTFNGSAAQSLGGTSVTTFNLLTINNSTGSTITLGNNVITSSNFLITKGNFDVSASNYSLTVDGNYTNNGTFTARSGTVTMNGAAAQSLGGTTSTSFYNLTMNNTGAAIITLGNNETVNNTLLLTKGTLDVSASNYSLTIGQTFTNNATFTQRNGTVTFTGNTSTPLNINGTTATTFYNLTTNPTNATDIVTLGKAMTVSNNFTISKGEFNSQNFQITGNATGKMTMAAGTNLLLGLTTVATNILFPTNYTAANTTLSTTSTVTYQANVAQTISATPTYGNVVVTNGAATVTKTPSGTPLNIAGNLTITQGTGALTVSETTNTINLTGNYTSTGTLSFSTGAFNIGGNFTNNGTFTAGTSTVTFDGSAAQSLGGTSATTFNLLTINNSGAATITLGNTTTVSSIFTISKGTLDVSASNYAFTVGGNFLNSGTFNAEAGTVTLNGAANQSLGGTSTTSFYNLTLSGKTITLNHNESLQSVLTMTTGTFNGPDSLTMISNSSLTARIAALPAAATIGATFVMQRYITGTTANYQSLSSPSKASILKDWDYDAGFYMSGVSGNDGNAKNGNTIYYSVYTFNEPTNAYDSVNTDNQPLTPGLGLYLWMGNSLTSFSPFTFDTRGIPNQGNVNYSVTKSDKGTNLIGNPYASPLQWTSFQTTNSSKLGTTFYVFDETTGNWESSNGTTGSGGRIASNPNILPAHQGFMVVASSAGVVTFKETHKSTSDAPVIRTISDPSDLLRISLTTNANTFSGHALIQFDDSSSDLYSENEDAIYINSHLTNAPVLYTLSKDGEQLKHNTLPALENTEDISLYAGGVSEGSYTLQFNNIDYLTKYNCVQLEDIKNGKWVQVTENSKYSFTVEAGQIYKFILHFRALAPSQDCNTPENTVSIEQNMLSGVDILPVTLGAQVRFTFSTQQEVSIAAYNALGQQVGNEIHSSVMDNSVDVPLPIAHNIYIIRVQSPYGVLNKRIYH